MKNRFEFLGLAVFAGAVLFHYWSTPEKSDPKTMIDVAHEFMFWIQIVTGAILMAIGDYLNRKVR